VIAELARLKARIGTVAVLGNHDWWQDGDLTQQTFHQVGIPLLDNNRLIVTPARRLANTGTEGLALCGVGDLWEDKQDYRRALDGLPARMPRLLLSHNPDVAEEIAFIRSGLRVDLMLSGHTHGGQVHIPLLGTPIVPSQYGQKYAHGLVQGPACPVFISRGIGVSRLPLRIGVSPEVAVLEFMAASS
jgi:predicted MPP superfamily phosphohydrolase